MASAIASKLEEFETPDDDSEDIQKVVSKLSSKLRPINTEPFLKIVQSLKLSPDVGKIPAVQWLPIKNLRINDTYQREVRDNGRSNVVQIAKNFNWSKFGIVLVAAIASKDAEPIFAIIDGQHRTLGAAIRGIEEVPCLILYGVNVEEQAEIFAAINGKVTSISPLAIFHAELAAKDSTAVEINNLCKEAGVTICRYVKPLNRLVKGETVSVNTIRDAVRHYDRKIVVLALKCILKASGNHTTLLNSNVIKAMCQTLESEGTFRVPEYRLISMMERFDLHSEWEAAQNDAKVKRKFVAGALSIRIFKYLDNELN